MADPWYEPVEGKIRNLSVTDGDGDAVANSKGEISFQIFFICLVSSCKVFFIRAITKEKVINRISVHKFQVANAELKGKTESSGARRPR